MIHVAQPEDIIAVLNGDVPLFTQREASDLSGLDMVSINNWIQRGFIELLPVNGRAQKGRRLFTKQQVLLFKVAATCLNRGIPVPDALEVATKLYSLASKALKSGHLLFEVPGKGLFVMWAILCGHSERVDGSTQCKSGTFWTFDTAVSPFHMMMFSDVNGDPLMIGPDRSSKALICLPMALLVHEVSFDVAKELTGEGADLAQISPDQRSGTNG